MKHEVYDFKIRPAKILPSYLAYAIGIFLSPLKFRKIKPDLILAYDIESGIAAILIKFIYRLPFVFHFIDDYSLITGYDKKRLRYQIVRRMERIIPRIADLVVVLGVEMKNFCLDLGVPEEKLRIVANGVNNKMFRPEKKDGSVKERFGLKESKIVLFVGKINRYYQLDKVLKAASLVLAELPDTKFLFVGDGDSLDFLKNFSQDLGINNSVVFTGFRPPEEIPEIINLADVCIFSLACGTALAVLEYMACGKSVVLPEGNGPKMGVSKEIIPKDCILRVENSPKSFAQGIIFFLRNEKMAKEMGKKARELVVKLYDWDILAKKYEEAFEHVLSAGKK